jgi:hypothetical protein
MAHGDAREGKWRGNWRMDWVASTLHNTSEHGVSSITTAHAQTSAASGRLNWRPRRIKWTRPFRRKTKSSFCACAITFQTQSKTHSVSIFCSTLCKSLRSVCGDYAVWEWKQENLGRIQELLSSHCLSSYRYIKIINIIILFPLLLLNICTI